MSSKSSKKKNLNEDIEEKSSKDREIERELWTSHNVLYKMMEDRKYKIVSSKLPSFSLFVKQYEEKDFKLELQAVFNKKQINVYWYDKLSTNIVNKHFHKIENENKHIIFVYKNCTSFATNLVTTINTTIAYTIEIFHIKEVMFNVTAHVYNPKFEILSKYDKNKLLQDYSITEDNLPKIQSNDPICRYYNAKSKDVFKIYRTKDGQVDLYYRIVI